MIRESGISTTGVRGNIAGQGSKRIVNRAEKTCSAEWESKVEQVSDADQKKKKKVHRPRRQKR